MRCATLAVSVVIALLVVSAAQAGMIASADFTFAYGATEGSGNVWSTTENTATNSPTTQGDFTLSPAPYSEVWSGAGPIFTNRTLGQGGSSDRSSYIGGIFTLPITGSYNGAAPADVDTSNPGYTLKLEVTNLSIWSLWDSGDGCTAPSNLAWSDVTAGHAATMSPAVDLHAYNGGSLAERARTMDPAYYTQVAWDPDDYSTSLGGRNDSFVRSFGFLGGGAADYRLIDGLEISGRVVLEYNSVPEPSTLALLMVGLVGLLAYAWRKRK
jgi:hypothetical protein